MRLIARFFLWLIGIAIPVVIAACYGIGYRFSKSGKVTDSKSKQGIDGIRISCVRSGQVVSSTSSRKVSYPSGNTGSGYFDIDYNTPCDELRFEDTDGPQNGGQYATKSMPFCESCSDASVELDLVN
jgi:hypothetical protein